MDYGRDRRKGWQKEQLHFLWRIPEASLRSRGLNAERRPYRDLTQRGRYCRDGLDEQYAHLAHSHTIKSHQLSSHEGGYRSSKSMYPDMHAGRRHDQEIQAFQVRL